MCACDNGGRAVREPKILFLDEPTTYADAVVTSDEMTQLWAGVRVRVFMCEYGDGAVREAQDFVSGRAHNVCV